MSTATEHANELFIRAALSDDNLGYPPRVAFVAADVEGAYRALVENLTARTPTVLVNAMGGERLLFPIRRTGITAPFLNLIDRRFGRIPVVAFERGRTVAEHAAYGAVGTYSTVRAGGVVSHLRHDARVHAHA